MRVKKEKKEWVEVIFIFKCEKGGKEWEGVGRSGKELKGVK